MTINEFLTELRHAIAADSISDVAELLTRYEREAAAKQQAPARSSKK